MKSIILAGGVGTRLWPLSRQYYPKQFIPLDGQSLFQKTYKRATRLSDPEEIFVVTNEIHQYISFVTRLRNWDTPFLMIIFSRSLKGKTPYPLSRGLCNVSGPLFLCHCSSFSQRYILGEAALDQIRASESLARKYLVTFGIKPTSPHTGYGISNRENHFRKEQLLMN